MKNADLGGALESNTAVPLLGTRGLEVHKHHQGGLWCSPLVLGALVADGGSP